ncbi:unnamed protein product [Dicrocoelium dendriticum]|nr:unnamed protein product [Dicrocoelium dendriticum]
MATHGNSVLLPVQRSRRGTTKIIACACMDAAQGYGSKHVELVAAILVEQMAHVSVSWDKSCRFLTK